MKPGSSGIATFHAEYSIDQDGTMIYRPLHISAAEPEVTTSEVAKLTGLSMRRIQSMCEEGFYITARKRGAGKKSGWLISLREVLEKRMRSAE